MSKVKRKHNRPKHENGSRLCYGDLFDADFYRQIEIDAVRAQHMLEAVTSAKNGTQIDKVELAELLQLLLGNLYSTLRGSIGTGASEQARDAWLKRKEDAAYTAACAHWPENLKEEPVQLLRIAA
jgi:HEAT repeat protein